MTTPDRTVPHVVTIRRSPFGNYWEATCTCFADGQPPLTDSARAVLDAAMQRHRDAQAERDSNPALHTIDNPNGGTQT